MHTLNQLLDIVKTHPDFNETGMVVFHNGVVRSTSRNGKKVSGMTVYVDHDKLKQIIKESHELSGIKVVLAETNEGFIAVGQDVMRVVVAGDIRENVFPALEKTVGRIKKEVVSKKEDFID